MDMSEQQHTPGPWHIESDGPAWHRPSMPTTIRWKPPTGNDYLRSDQMGDYRGVIVCDMTEGHGDRSHAAAESWANARLIAAAPELLVSLKRAANAVAAASSHVPSTMNKQMDLAWSTAQDAIAKAEGKTEPADAR